MISEKKEEKRWFEGWVMLMADGYGEKRVAQEEKRKRKKKKKGWSEGREPLVVNELVRKRQDTKNRGHSVNIFTKMPL